MGRGRRRRGDEKLLRDWDTDWHYWLLRHFLSLILDLGNLGLLLLYLWFKSLIINILHTTALIGRSRLRPKCYSERSTATNIHIFSFCFCSPSHYTFSLWIRHCYLPCQHTNNFTQGCHTRFNVISGCLIFLLFFQHDNQMSYPLNDIETKLQKKKVTEKKRKRKKN